jgi:FtsP/CotA-like multicopper oxidase with cupredoxin domain
MRKGHPQHGFNHHDSGFAATISAEFPAKGASMASSQSRGGPKTAASSSLSVVAIVLACAIPGAFSAAADAVTPQPECSLSMNPKNPSGLESTYGGAPFASPPEVKSRDGVLTYYLVTDYATNTIAGCKTTLRSYNGKLVGDTWRVKPGDELRIKLINNLPPRTDTHPEVPPPKEHAGHFSFNITNLHTHGLHVSPKDHSDNVFREVHPQETKEYVIKIPADHPAGTFWYHAHLHGSTAIQVSSGMVGTIVIEGATGLDAVPEIKAAKEQVFVLQQFAFDENGQMEDFNADFPSNPTISTAYGRHIMVNGQLLPTIRMRPGEVQRWRFVHAGIQENISLSLEGHALNEIAADGIPLGRMVAWTGPYPLLLTPGNRTDVLVKAQLRAGETRSVYLLHDGKVAAQLSLQAFAKALSLAQGEALPQNRAERAESIIASPEFAEALAKPPANIAQLIVEGQPLDPDMKLPEKLDGTIPPGFDDIKDSELTGKEQTVQFLQGTRICGSDGACTPCTSGPNCLYHYHGRRSRRSHFHAKHTSTTIGARQSIQMDNKNSKWHSCIPYPRKSISDHALRA